MPLHEQGGSAVAVSVQLGPQLTGATELEPILHTGLKGDRTAPHDRTKTQHPRTID